MSSSGLKDSATHQSQLTTREGGYNQAIHIPVICHIGMQKRVWPAICRCQWQGFSSLRTNDISLPFIYSCLYSSSQYACVYALDEKRKTNKILNVTTFKYMDSIHFNAACQINHAYNYVQGTRVVCGWWWKTHSTLYQCSQDQFNEINLSLISSMKAYGVMLSSYMSTQSVYVK